MRLYLVSMRWSRHVWYSVQGRQRGWQRRVSVGQPGWLSLYIGIPSRCSYIYYLYNAWFQWLGAREFCPRFGARMRCSLPRRSHSQLIVSTEFGPSTAEQSWHQCKHPSRASSLLTAHQTTQTGINSYSMYSIGGCTYSSIDTEGILLTGYLPLIAYDLGECSDSDIVVTTTRMIRSRATTWTDI